MAFEDLLVALRHDQLGELRREETLQPPDPAQLIDLLGDEIGRASCRERVCLYV